jgi:primosomal protein N'
VRELMTPNQFHEHLDACKRCREQPFNLCPAGAQALRKAVDAAMPTAKWFVGKASRSTKSGDGP